MKEQKPCRFTTARLFWCARRDLNPHALALDPKSSVSANSTTGAYPAYPLVTIDQASLIDTQTSPMDTQTSPMDAKEIITLRLAFVIHFRILEYRHFRILEYRQVFEVFDVKYLKID